MKKTYIQPSSYFRTVKAQSILLGSTDSLIGGETGSTIDVGQSKGMGIDLDLEDVTGISLDNENDALKW